MTTHIVRKISVVIPVRNGAATIADQLEGLASQDYEGYWEIIVANNGSTDGTVEIVERFMHVLPNMRIVDASKRRGINHARNIGARAAEGDGILFCDSDDIVAPHWVSAMNDGLEEYDGVGGTLNLDHAINSSAVLLRARGSSRPLRSDFLPRPVGCNCGVSREVFEYLGGFNEKYAGGGDETEFFWRLQLSGFSLGFVPEATVNYRLPSRLWPALRSSYRKQRAVPQLYRDFRRQGMPSRPLWRQFGSWALLFARLHWCLRGREDRLRWLGYAAVRLGGLAGSFRYRVLYL